MHTFRTVCLLLAVTFLRPLYAEDAPATRIAQDGKAKYAVVIANNADVAERHAAEELAAFLKQITGTEFLITEKKPADKQGMFIGKYMAKRLKLDSLLEGLDAEAFLIKSIPNGILFCGGEPRGTLYAVYTFLEEYAGCHWWSSTASTIPQNPALVIPTLNVRQTPALRFRHPYFRDAMNGDWSVRNKCSTHSGRVSPARAEELLKKREVNGCHTFNALIPPNTYFKDHPEWFSQLNNRRQADRSQLCLSNAEMRAELIENVRQKLRKDPQIGIYSVSQNDWGNRCQCEHCRALEEKYGGASGVYVWFINQIAEAIEEEFPNVLLSTFAYQFTRHPPTGIRPRKNVVIRLCSIECNFSYPLSHRRNKSFRNDIIGWSKICNRLYIWDYVVNFRHYVMPHPNLDVLDDNVRFFVEHGAIGVMEQGAYNASGTELAELRAWVLAKLLWNPQQDVWDLVRTFCDGYYGAGGKHIVEYLQTLHAAHHRTEDKIGPFNNYMLGSFNYLTLRACWEHLQAAEDAVKDDADLRARVQVAQLPLLYIVMMRWMTLQVQKKIDTKPWPWAPDIRQQFEEFMKVVKANNITKQAEHRVKAFEKLDEATKNAAFRF